MLSGKLSSRVGARREGRRRANHPSSGGDLATVAELDLIDVTLQTETSGQPSEVPGLGLRFAEPGLTVKKPSGAPYALIPWVSITQVAFGVLGTRRHHLCAPVRLDVVTKRKRHRFVVPNVQPEGLTSSLRAMAERYGRGAVVVNDHGRRLWHR
jgi:hypothetical protein